jgi:hypothetical protein
MKKIRIIALVLPLIFMVAFQAKAQFSIGIKAIRNHAWLHYKEGTYNEEANLTIWGYAGAITLDKQFSKYLSVGIEASMIQRGSKCEPDFILSSSYSDAKLVANYLSLPVLLKAHYPILKHKLRVTAEIGGSCAYFLTGQRVLTSKDKTRIPDLKTNLDMKQEVRYNRFDVGFDGGLGLSFPLKRGFIDLNAHYYLGLKNTVKRVESKNRNLAYEFGYRFVL